MNFDEINFDEVKEVQVINSRTNYDLRYSKKTGKFNLSQAAFDRLNIADNGFNVMTYKGELILQVVPNSEAKLHSGRAGYNKGLTFTSDVVAQILGIENGDAYYTIDEYVHNNRTFLTLERINTEKQEESITSEMPSL